MRQAGCTSPARRHLLFRHRGDDNNGHGTDQIHTDRGHTHEKLEEGHAVGVYSLQGDNWKLRKQSTAT